MAAGGPPGALDRLRGVAAPSLDGRWFRAIEAVDGSEVDSATLFRYSEDGEEISAVYGGGQVRRGHLIGTRAGDRLDFRYVQLNAQGQTSSGHCVSTIHVLGDGRLRMDETWEWESRPGSGTSVVEEIPQDGGG